MDIQNISKLALTPEQQKHYDSIMWLFGGPRGVGKTRTLAAAMIDESLRSGEHIVLFDHDVFKGKAPMYNDQLIQCISDISSIIEKHVKVELKLNGHRTLLIAKVI